jgi:hypothetical protein
MREVQLPDSELPVQVASFLACLATILELPLEQLPRPAAHEERGHRLDAVAVARRAGDRTGPDR